ncbi:hypothetical protein R3W88_018065 [Solanum pinnatisectum]|uniref:Uncharacterized protein n=1 Tax=Solanum pinnatisectum TaxID=50273 RepID=A0AAV9L645_9SOLN|nr:hypothetical protein R3W88_018065 [Solanum pinnatisectum]
MLSIVSKKIIKPFTPTPSTQRWHKLSILDQCLTHFYMPFVFFYPKNQLLITPHSNVKELTFPHGVPWGNGVDRALIVAQLSHFDCGGVALSVCLSHKIGDGSSANCFLRDWAALTRTSNTNPSPYFIEDQTWTNVSKRGLFSLAQNLAVNALVYKCAASSATIVNSGSFKQSQLVQFFDLREIISPPLPPNSIGNLLTIFSSPIYEKEKAKNILSTRNIVEENEYVMEMLNAYRTGEEPFHKRKCDLYFSSSLCKFPFLQNLDFGFGKPIRASFAKGPRNTFIILMRTY